MWGALCKFGYFCKPRRRVFDNRRAGARRVLRAAREANDVAQRDDELAARRLFQ